jgi:hypothetical protein
VQPPIQYELMIKLKTSNALGVKECAAQCVMQIALRNYNREDEM